MQWKIANDEVMFLILVHINLETLIGKVIYVQPLFKNDGLCLLYMCMHSAVFHNELCHLNFSLAQLYCIFKGAEICVTLYGFFKLYNLL